MTINEENLKRIVEEAGTERVGIQDRSLVNKEPLVLFNDKYGNTLALDVSDLTVETVKSRIASNDILW